MARIRLLHWKASEAGKCLSTLAAVGHTVQYHEDFNARSLRDWRARPPDAFVIDLSRLPAQGREIAIALRQSPATRVCRSYFAKARRTRWKKFAPCFPTPCIANFQNCAVSSAKRLCARRR